jgi:magnesium chelatase subunit D
MSTPLFPFTALVGLESLKLALQLAALDEHLSVLARGDRGSGKTTAARGLGALLAPDAPFVNLPIGATEDRVLGGLDVERAMKGEPALKPGVVNQANGGVLYIDEVNLLPDHLADPLLDAVASGIHVLEREGFSAIQEARFVLVGSMNPEEGALRPQLLDRFALSVDVVAPTDPVARRLVVERRLRFDADPARFASEWNREQQDHARRIAAARGTLAGVDCPADVLDYIAHAVCERGVRSLRADLATVRASRALAALHEASGVTRAHVDAVLPFVLGHRAATHPPGGRPGPPPPSPSPSPPAGAQQDNSQSAPTAGQDRVFAAVDMRGPQLVTPSRSSVGQTEGGAGARRGAAMHAKPSPSPVEIDARATVVQALASTGSAQPRIEDLHEKVRVPLASRRFVFVVDASGSQAVQQRMRFVKGAVVAMLEQSARRQDEVVLIAFRGPSATLVLPPTRSIEDAAAALAYLPTGGRTPLAHGLELAAQYVTDSTTVVLLTDGRANVPSRSADAWADALHAASALECASLVVDSESGPNESGRARQLADVLGAAHVRLDEIDETSMVRLIREP